MKLLLLSLIVISNTLFKASYGYERPQRALPRSLTEEENRYTSAEFKELVVSFIFGKECEDAVNECVEMDCIGCFSKARLLFEQEGSLNRLRGLAITNGINGGTNDDMYGNYTDGNYTDNDYYDDANYTDNDYNEEEEEVFTCIDMFDAMRSVWNCTAPGDGEMFCSMVETCWFGGDSGNNTTTAT